MGRWVDLLVFLLVVRILSIKPKTFVFQIPGADALGHFSLLLDEDLAAQHEQHRQNRNKNKQL